jgi:hypothetical protein
LDLPSTPDGHERLRESGDSHDTAKNNKRYSVKLSFTEIKILNEIYSTHSTEIVLAYSYSQPFKGHLFTVFRFTRKCNNGVTV